MKTQVTYVMAIMHISHLVAQANKEARKAMNPDWPWEKRKHQDRAIEFFTEADKISQRMFGFYASHLL